ncbi:hypothetical protein NIES4103_24890 [Nostoc sp. NIES-4103]|nr:hypothetical protein NIES4103_24890 [Nostoc sp. NIES-4103]
MNKQTYLSSFYPRHLPDFLQGEEKSEVWYVEYSGNFNEFIEQEMSF